MNPKDTLVFNPLDTLKITPLFKQKVEEIEGYWDEANYLMRKKLRDNL